MATFVKILTNVSKMIITVTKTLNVLTMRAHTIVTVTQDILETGHFAKISMNAQMVIIIATKMQFVRMRKDFLPVNAKMVIKGMGLYVKI